MIAFLTRSQALADGRIRSGRRGPHPVVRCPRPRYIAESAARRRILRDVRPAASLYVVISADRPPCMLVEARLEAYRADWRGAPRECRDRLRDTLGPSRSVIAVPGRRRLSAYRLREHVDHLWSVVTRGLGPCVGSVCCKLRSASAYAGAAARSADGRAAVHAGRRVGGALLVARYGMPGLQGRSAWFS